MLSQPEKYLDLGNIKIHTRTFYNALETALRVAQHRVYICAYVVTANRNRKSDLGLNICERLGYLKQHDRIDVRVAMDLPRTKKNNWNCNHSFMRYFHSIDVPVKCLTQKSTLHAKMILVDSKVLFIGSHNIAMSSLLNPNEITVEITSPGLIDQMAHDYEQWWETLKAPAIRPGV